MPALHALFVAFLTEGDQVVIARKIYGGTEDARELEADLVQAPGG